MTNLDDTAQVMLLAGELVHIDKNTSFGFGSYSLVKARLPVIAVQQGSTGRAVSAIKIFEDDIIL